MRLHTDTGLVGIGESYPTHEAHVGALKEIAPLILGKDPTRSSACGRTSSIGSPISRGAAPRVPDAHGDQHCAVGHPRQGVRPAGLQAARRQGAGEACWSTTP